MIKGKLPENGPSQRQLRAAEQVRHVVAEVLARGELHDDALSAMIITVPEVRMSPDLRIATVLVMPLGGQGEAEAVAALNKNAKALRFEVSRRLREMKYSPELRFRLDDRYDEAARVDRLFSDRKVAQDLEPEQDFKPEEDTP
jgi:ribosome-binding factor A